MLNLGYRVTHIAKKVLQTLKFKAPCPVGSEVVARVVLERSMGRMAKFRTTCAAVRGSDPGSVMVEGEAFAQMP